MKKSAKAIKEQAEELGITVDELLEEMEVGNPNKPFTLVVSFERYAELLAFAKALSTKVGLGVYKADALDHEYAGRAPQNSFVLRTIDGQNGKPEDWRVA